MDVEMSGCQSGAVRHAGAKGLRGMDMLVFALLCGIMWGWGLFWGWVVWA